MNHEPKAVIMSKKSKPNDTGKMKSKKYVKLMLDATDTKWAPWHILHSDDKKRARLNCLAHILSLIPYKKVPHEEIKMPKRSMKHAYDDQATLKGRKFVPQKY